MITIKVIPAATVTSQLLLVEIEEGLCTSYCINGIKPMATISFNAGEVKTINGYAVVPIVASMVLTWPNDGCNCGCAKQRVFVEKAEVAFTATATNAITLSQGASVLVEPTKIRCCKASGVKATTTLRVTIA